MPSSQTEVLQGLLEEVNEELKQAGVDDLLARRSALEAGIAALNGAGSGSKAVSKPKGSSTAPQAVLSVEEIKAAWTKTNKKRLNSKEIAAALGVDGRRVGRRLIALAEAGDLKREGDFYTIPAAS
jgi:hypothetical protein